MDKIFTGGLFIKKRKEEEKQNDVKLHGIMQNNKEKLKSNTG